MLNRIIRLSLENRLLILVAAVLLLYLKALGFIIAGSEPLGSARSDYE